MTKQELTQAAKAIRDECKSHSRCDESCPFRLKESYHESWCVFTENWSACDWDIERLEREE